MIKLNDKSLLKNDFFINGKWIKANSHKVFPIINPFNQKIISEISDAGEEDAKHAVNAASEAFKTWRKTSPEYRANLLRKLQALILQNIDDLASILTTEQGKPLQESFGEIESAAMFVGWYAEEALRIHGQTIIPTQDDLRRWTIRQPLGVVFAITPWNFPFSLAVGQCAPALAAGCTIILKPSEETPLIALAMAELMQRAGFPAGVINILCAKDPKPVSEVVLSDERVRKLAFTGSTKVGKILMAQASHTVKRLCMEMGGNNPLLVFADADIKLAVEHTFGTKFFNSGQVCTTINRFFLQSEIYEQFIKLFSEQCKKLNQGNGLDKKTNLGPLINKAGLDKVEQLVNDALASGARLILGGKRVHKDQLFFEPTILAEVTPKMRIYHEEIFGPVVTCCRFTTESEVLNAANNTLGGLAAYAYTRNIDLAFRLSEALEAGMVSINTCNNFSPLSPFCGHKQSGLGRQGGITGSLDDYYELKSVNLGMQT